MKEKSRRFQILSWCLFDFANSSFTTVIVTVVFSVYFVEVIAEDDGGPQLWNIALIISNLAIVLSAPIVGAMADSTRKKMPLGISYVICVVCTAGLFFTGAGAWLPAIILFIVANIAYATGENLVAGFLPDLAEKEEMGRISAFGWALGYGGGLIALAICLPLAMTKRDDLLRATSPGRRLLFPDRGPSLPALRQGKEPTRSTGARQAHLHRIRSHRRDMEPAPPLS